MTDDLSLQLSKAIELDEIVPFFQPIVDLQDQRLVGFEILARWDQPLGRIIPPAEFIPQVEKSGLIVDCH